MQHVDNLLSATDPQAVRITNRYGRSSFLLLGDHAGNLVPEKLDNLGLEPAELARHIGWDLGVSALGMQLSALLDAPFIEQRYSRLVIDCNRALDHPTSIVEQSDGTPVPANAALTAEERAARADAIFHPYQGAIAALLAEREAAGQPMLVIALHSFTPRLEGFDRPWEIGVLYNGGDERLARTMLAILRQTAALTTGDNQPYHMDETDFTVPAHAISRALPYVELEIRQDEIARADRPFPIHTLLHTALLRSAEFCGFVP